MRLPKAVDSDMNIWKDFVNESHLFHSFLSLSHCLLRNMLFNFYTFVYFTISLCYYFLTSFIVIKEYTVHAFNLLTYISNGSYFKT